MSNEPDLEVIVHELRSPVAALAAVLEALSSGHARNREERDALLAIAIRACGDIERMVADASLFSLNVSEVALDELARDVVGAFNGRDETPVRLEVAGPVPPVLGDPVRLRQAVANLVGNAIAHAPPGTDVSVVVVPAADASAVSVGVSDAGEGLEPESESAIFERGTRLALQRPGSGIGLYVARAVAEAHGGRIELESQPGRGATFTLVLPCSRGAERDQARL